MKGYWTILNHLKLVKYELLDNNKSEIYQVHMFDNTSEAGYFAPLTFSKNFDFVKISSINDLFYFIFK